MTGETAMTGRDTRDPHELYAELAVGHALSSLEPADEQVFLAHLPGCARCKRDLVAHRETAAHLAYAAAAVEPPPALLQGIRAGVSESGQAVRAPRPVPIAAARSRRRLFVRGGALVGAAAAVALVASLVASNVSLRQDRQQTSDRSGRLTAAVRQIEGDGARTVPLHSPDSSVAAVALLRAGSVSLVVDGLPRNDTRSSTYVLWKKGRYGGAEAVGTFDVKAEGVDVIKDLPLTAGEQVRALTVTLEKGRVAPAGASTPMLVTGKVA